MINIKQKTYNWVAISSFSSLKKLLEEGYTEFNCNMNFRSEWLMDDDMISISQYSYIVTWYFSCSYNNLTSLIGCPKKVWLFFNCSNNKLTSLIGCPKEILWDLNCSWNKLTSLEWINDINGLKYIHQNPFMKIKKINKYIFKLWSNIYYWDINQKIIDVLNNFDSNINENLENFSNLVEKDMNDYVNLFKSFIKLTTKLENNDTNSYLEINGKKFKKKILWFK